MEFKDFDLSEFVRYTLTGFNFLLFVLILPYGYWRPTQFVNLWIDLPFLTLLLLSIAIGYLFDILKVYQFTPRFDAKKKKFRAETASILEIPIEQAPSYFSLISKVWGEQSPYDLERRRSEWILELHTTVILFVAAMVWGGILVFSLQKSGFVAKDWAVIFAIVVSLAGAVRVYKIAEKERQRLNRDFIIIVHENRSSIQKMWHISTESQNRVDDGKN